MPNTLTAREAAARALEHAERLRQAGATDHMSILTKSVDFLIELGRTIILFFWAVLNYRL